MKGLLIHFLTLFLIILFFSSCVNTKKLSQEAIYFQNLNDSLLKQSTVNYSSEVQKGDLLSVNVSTSNDASYRILNQSTSPIAGGPSSSSVGRAESTLGYLVDNEGNITFPLIGKIRAAGLTTSRVNDSIQLLVSKYVSDAIVSVRLINFKITVLGEVVRPGSMSIPNERVTILDAIGLAGDLTVFGRRDNIKIIREIDGKRELGILNLKSGDIFNSPYFYLRQNDVVYVEMTERKMANLDQASTRNFTIALAAISTLAIIISTINNL